MEATVVGEVRSEDGETHFLMTWGRIQDPIDPRPLESLALRAATQFQLGSRPVAARVCATLQEAGMQPYFYEALLAFARKPIPLGDGYEEWRAATAAAMVEGRDFYFLGRSSG